MSCLRTLCLIVYTSQAAAALLPVSFNPPGGLLKAPALLMLTNPNPSGAIFYTLNASDPRDVFGAVSTNALLFEPPAAAVPARSFPLSVHRPMIVTARVKSGANWSPASSAAFSVDQDFSKLLFTEVLFHAPPNPTNPALGNIEFLELKNTGTVAIDLSGLELRNLRTTTPRGLYHTFPQGTQIAAGTFLVLSWSRDAFESYYPEVMLDALFNGPASRLDHEGAEVVLRSSEGAVAAGMRWNTHAPWPVVPDDHGYFHGQPGFTLVRTNFDATVDPRDFRSWTPSAGRLGSPRADDPPIYRPPIRISELLTRPSAAHKDTVELFNPTSEAVDLSGWWLSDQRNSPYRFQLPAGTVIPPMGFSVFSEGDFNVGSNAFSFDGSGERCYVFSSDTNGVLTGYSDGLMYAGSERDTSFGRHRASTGESFIMPGTALTFGAANAPPAPKALIITEILYAPNDSQPGFIELHNPSDAPLLLNGWSFGDSPATEFTQSFFFPSNTAVAAGGYLLLVDSDAVAFRILYNVPNDTPIFSYVSGFSANMDGGKMLRLYRAATGGSPHVVIDEVPYENHAPWPVEAAGGGASLERLGNTPFGFDAWHWRANPEPTPGRANRTNLPPQVWAGGARTNLVLRTITICGDIADDRWPGTTLTSWWSQVSGPAALTLESNTPASINVAFPVAGEYALRLTATDGVFTTMDETIVHVHPRSFELWRGNYFTVAELQDVHVSGASADPDGDGLPNVDEYFFATSPKLSDASNPVRAAVASQSLELSWVQRAEVPDVAVAVEMAHRISGPWFAAPGLFQGTTTPGPAPGTLAVRHSPLFAPGTNTQLFLRLSRTLSP